MLIPSPAALRIFSGKVLNTTSTFKCPFSLIPNAAPRNTVYTNANRITSVLHGMGSLNTNLEITCKKVTTKTTVTDMARPKSSILSITLFVLNNLVHLRCYYIGTTFLWCHFRILLNALHNFYQFRSY